MERIYLDNNATTNIHPEVVAGMQQDYLEGFGNPASQHHAGRRARKVLEAARDAIIELLGGETAGRHPDRLIFTSGGTESNNLALRGFAGDAPSRVVISAVEHPSVVVPAEYLHGKGMELAQLGVDHQGVVCLDQLPSLLSDTTRLVSVMLGNNETGVLQPVEAIAGICNERGIPVHTDAVQAVGKTAVNFRRLGVAALSFSAHKFHGPTGIGGLLVRGDVTLAPVLFGGFQQAGLRPGTESVVLARGMCQALQLWQRDHAACRARMVRLRERLERALKSHFPGVVVNGDMTPRLPHTSCVAFPGIDRQALVMALDAAGVACSSGSACASGSSDPSPVLLAMGLPSDIVSSSIRLSISSFTTEMDVDEAANRIVRIASDLRSGSQRRRPPPTPRVAPAKPI